VSLKFIHAADLHLDSPLRGLAAYEDAPLERIRGATRLAFSQLVTVAIERGVDLLLLAGDIWDGDWPHIGTGLYFASEMGRLQRENIRVFMIRGNHDAESRISKTLTLPDNVTILNAQSAQSVCVEDLNVVIHGQSFSRPDVTENIALHYPDAVPGFYNIGLLHTALEGDAQHASYAPCRLSELQSKAYDYWALGHVHRECILADGNHTAGGTIVYPGVLQGRHVRETGAKGAYLVESSGTQTHIERLIVDVVRWHDLEVDVNEALDWPDVARAMGASIRAIVTRAHDASYEGLLAVRLTVTGTTTLHGQLSSNTQQLRIEALGQIAAIGAQDIFLEKVKVRTTSGLVMADLEQRHDAIASVQRILAQAAQDTEFMQELANETSYLWNSLPEEVRTALKLSEPERMQAIESGDLRPLLPDLSTTLLAQLTQQ